ncbi:MAG: hypothetical protein HKP10_06070, partial [Kiritimatiellales bacterium]|nr:hypothetical protein [Kiritimatiellales bacterium]
MKLIPLLRAAIVVVFLLTSLSSYAAVTHWRVVKGPFYLQSADNAPDTSTTNWGIYGVVETDLPGDAASVVITGGNISGSIPYGFEDGEWNLDAVYPSKAALDAVFPSDASYSIILSGGTLGSVTQDITYAADAYPNTPYLTGADYSDCLALEALEPFEINWNNAGTTTTVSLEIYTGAQLDEGDTVFEIYSNNYSSVAMPWNLFVANSNYNGFIDFANADLQSGAGGFGIDGDVSFNTSLAFHIDTVNTAVDYDDFSGGTNSSWISFLSEPGKQFTPTNDVLEFTSGTGPDGDSVAWIYDTDALSYTQDWSVAVDLANHIDPSTLTIGQELYFTLVVGSDDLSYLFLLENYMQELYSEIFLGVDTNGVEDVFNASAQISEEQLSLKVSFDADTKLLTGAYSFGGDYIVLTNFPTADWGFSDSDTFIAALSCGTDSLAISSGELYADNFRIYGETALSNDVSRIELEYLRSYEYPDSPSNEQNNWYLIDVLSSYRVDSISVLTAAGDYVVLPDGSPAADVNNLQETSFEAEEAISEPWDPANDGDWTITFGFTDGTFRSTVVPFAQTNGAAIPVINKRPFFTAPVPLHAVVTNTSSLSVTFNTADTNANYVEISEWIEEDQDTEPIRFYSDGLSDVLGVAPVFDGPLSTTSAVIPIEEGEHEWLLSHGWARSDYNDDGIGYIVVKQTESIYMITITADVDGDNMDDDWELEFFGGTNVVNGGAEDDFDGDGFSNVEEFIAGINPTNSGSVFAVEEPGPSPSGFVINWNSVEGREYAVY